MVRICRLVVVRRPEIIMPQTFAVILFLNSFKNVAIIPQPFATILTLFSTSEVKSIVNIVILQHQ